MELKTLYDRLKEVAPTAYSHFNIGEAKAPPFITYYYMNNDDFIADNVNYKAVNNIAVALYVDKKDLAIEKQIEDIFISLETPFSKTETWIESENFYEIFYEIEII